MLKKFPLLAAFAVVLMLSGCFEDKKAEAPAAEKAAAEAPAAGESSEADEAMMIDGSEEMPEETAVKAAPEIDISALADGEWLLESIRGKAITAGGKPSLAVDAEGKVNGDSGCNRFHAETRPKPDNKITFLGIGSTKRACVDMARNNQEMKFLSELLSIAAWHVDEETNMLYLTDANGGDVLIFSKAPASEVVPAE
jgi:heat shock protein HslJ